MIHSSTKQKIYIGLFLWLVLCFGVFSFVFGRFGASNQTLLGNLMLLKKEEARLLAEKESFQQAKNDLAKLSSEELQPEAFFSKDITLVNEIRRLEAIGGDLGVKLTLSGIAGTLKSAAKAKTVSEIYQITYNINVQGPLAKVVSFMEYLENLEFITSVSNANFSTAGSSGVNASFTAVYYIKGKK